MTPEIHWQEIALRLILTVLAGGLLGMERSRTGHAAGLRTTLLVTLAASIAMIQMNLLIATNGKPSNSYAVMDLMRLPLGILTGVGFIGAGAIVRKNELVLGITTAATLWFATVIGLCMGGGQKILGASSTVIGLGVLWGLRKFENKVEYYQRAELRMTLTESGLSAEEMREWLQRENFRIKSFSVCHTVSEQSKAYVCEVRWPAPRGSSHLPPILKELDKVPGLIELEWKSIGTAPS